MKEGAMLSAVQTITPTEIGVGVVLAFLFWRLYLRCCTIFAEYQAQDRFVAAANQSVQRAAQSDSYPDTEKLRVGLLVRYDLLKHRSEAICLLFKEVPHLKDAVEAYMRDMVDLLCFCSNRWVKQEEIEDMAEACLEAHTAFIAHVTSDQAPRPTLRKKLLDWNDDAIVFVGDTLLVFVEE